MAKKFNREVTPKFTAVALIWKKVKVLSVMKAEEVSSEWIVHLTARNKGNQTYSKLF